MCPALQASEQMMDFGSDGAHCSVPGESLVLSLGGPQNSLAHSGVPSVAPHGLAKGTTEAPNRCGCCPVNSDAKRPLAKPILNEHGVVLGVACQTLTISHDEPSDLGVHPPIEQYPPLRPDTRPGMGIGSQTTARRAEVE